MALIIDTLFYGLAFAFQSYPDSKEQAASDLAQAYYDYASAGTFGLSLPALTPAHKTALEATLLAGMTGTISAFAMAWQTGIITFWTGVPVAGASGTGVSVPAVETNSIAASLEDAMNQYYADFENVASYFALALETGTGGTQAYLTIIPNPPVLTFLS